MNRLVFCWMLAFIALSGTEWRSQAQAQPPTAGNPVRPSGAPTSGSSGVGGGGPQGGAVAPTGLPTAAPRGQIAPPTLSSIPTALPSEVEALADKWREAWKLTPSLVSLRPPGEDTFDGSVETLEPQYKSLLLKKISNKAWTRYWEKQAELTSALIVQLKGLGTTGGLYLSGVSAWDELARDKVVNQAAFFEALEIQEREVKARLDAARQNPEEKLAPQKVVSDELTPYKARRVRLDVLTSEIKVEKQRKRAAEANSVLIEQLLVSQRSLCKAQAIDSELARRERNIGHRELNNLQNVSKWRMFWTDVGGKARKKTAKIEMDEKSCERAVVQLDTEKDVLLAEVTARTKRVESLSAEYKTVGGMDEWLTATWETLLDWLKERAWRILFGLFVIYLIVRFALKLIRRFQEVMESKAEGDPDDPSDDNQRFMTLAKVFTGVSRIAVYIIGGLLALEQIGVDTGPILGSVAILGLAISFGSQNLVRDVVNGFFILLENQYAVGEVVTLGGKTGTVEKITIRSTWIRQATGDVHVFPNGEIRMVSNLTREWSKATVHVSVSYHSDLALVEKVINQVGDEMFTDADWKPVLETAPQWIGVTELAQYAVIVRVQATVEAGSQWGVTRELNRRIKLAFDEAGIEIPFPQRVVHTRA